MHRKAPALSLFMSIGAVVMVFAADRTHRLDIPAQPLAAALQAFAEQTGLQLVFETRIAAGRTSPEVKGEFSDRKALQRLLGDSGLTFRFLDERTVAVSPSASAGDER